MEKQINNWENQIKFEFENYYSTYLYSLKYTFGFTSQAYTLAKKMKMDEKYKKKENCMKAADEIIKLNLNIQNTKEIYKEIRTSLERFVSLRKGFYCVICD